MEMAQMFLKNFEFVDPLRKKVTALGVYGWKRLSIHSMMMNKASTIGEFLSLTTKVYCRISTRESETDLYPHY